MKNLQELLHRTEFRVLLFCLFLGWSSWPLLAPDLFPTLAGRFTFLISLWAVAVGVLFLARGRPAGPPGERLESRAGSRSGTRPAPGERSDLGEDG